MATHFSVLAWEIPWTQEPGGLQSMGAHRMGRERATIRHACKMEVQALPHIMLKGLAEARKQANPD